MKIPTYIGFNPETKKFFDETGQPKQGGDLAPDIMIGQKKLYNLDLKTVNSAGELVDYTKIPTGATFELIVDNDYSNPVFSDLNNTSWINTTGNEYQYTAALSAKPYELYENNSLMTEGTAGSLAVSEWAWDSGTLKVTVRLSDDTNPTSKDSGYIQYVESSFTKAFIVVQAPDFNITNTWYDLSTKTFRDPIPENGEITYTVDATTSDFIDRIGSSSSVTTTNAQLDIKEPATGDSMDIILHQFVCRNKYLANPLSPTETTVNVYTKAESDAKYVNKDFSILGTKATLVDADTIIANDSEDSGNLITVTLSKITTYLTGTFLAKLWTSFTDKATPVDADLLALNDSTSSFSPKKLSWANLKATLKTYFDTIYFTIGAILDKIQFNTSFTTPAHSEGLLFYNQDCKCLTYYNDNSEQSINISYEGLVKCRNISGSSISNGTVVYITGADSDYPTIEPADATNFTKSRMIGVATVNITDSSNGDVNIWGLVNDINTAVWAVGTLLYIDPANPGQMTSTRPTGGNFAIQVGSVTIQDAVNGQIYINKLISNYTEEINNVTGWSTGMDDNFSYSFVDGTRTFTITFDNDIYFYEKGEKYTKLASDVSESIVISNTTGTHWIYYDAGVLTESVNPSDATLSEIIRSKVLVSNLYWNASTGNSVFGVAREWHGIGNGEGMPSSVHAYLHFIFGAQYLNGLALSGFTIGAGSLNSHAQFGIDSGYIQDEDLTTTIDAVASTVGLPIYYKNGANGVWTLGSNSGYSFLVGATPLAQFNEYTGGAWQLTEATSGNYIIQVIGVINAYETSKRYFSIVGIDQYASTGSAEVGANDLVASLTRESLPFQEAVIVGAVVYQTKASFTNSVNTAIATVNGANYIDFRTSAISGTAVPVTDHNALAGRSEASAHPATSIDIADAGAYYTGTTVEAALQEIGAGGLGLPLTTKGDLLGYSTSSVRVPVGSNNQLIIADSAEAVGWKWWTPTFGNVTGVASSTDNAIVRFDSTTGKLIQNSLITITDAGKITFPDISTTGIINMTARSVEPSAPANGDSYLDDGTNTASGDKALRHYNGSTWDDLGGGTTGNEVSGTFVDGDLTAGVLTITHTYGVWYPSGFSIYDNNNQKIVDSDDVTISNNTITVDLSSFGTLTGTWRYYAGDAVSSGASSPLTTKGDIFTYSTSDARLPVGTNGQILTADSTEATGIKWADASGGTSWFSEWQASAFPQDINTVKWTNITAFPPINYDDYNTPTFDVAYNGAEGIGVFLIEIPADTTNLLTKILAIPETPGATGSNMDWEMDFCIYRAGSAQGTITNITLANTAFNATGDTETAYSTALSSITDGTLTATAGDTLAIVLYPNTTDATSPKQCDWQVRKVRFEVS